MDKEKKCSFHSTGQEQGYSFVAAFITEQMSLSLVDSVEAARLNRGFPPKNAHWDTIWEAPPSCPNPWNKQEPDNIPTERHGKIWAVCVWPCSGKKIFTRSTPLFDVLQAQVAPGNKWMFVSLIPLCSPYRQYTVQSLTITRHLKSAPVHSCFEARLLLNHTVDWGKTRESTKDRRFVSLGWI